MAELTREQAIENLRAVLCDPEGKCCITGSDEDRRIITAALRSLSAPSAIAATDEEREAVIACLGDDAVKLFDANPFDEMAENMQKAAAMLAAAPAPAQETGPCACDDGGSKCKYLNGSPLCDQPAPAPGAEVPRVEVAATWQPIETAPKDGKDYLFYKKGHISEARWLGEGKGFGGNGWSYDLEANIANGRNEQPTHWMPLPEAPQQGPVGVYIENVDDKDAAITEFGKLVDGAESFSGKLPMVCENGLCIALTGTGPLGVKNAYRIADALNAAPAAATDALPVEVEPPLFVPNEEMLIAARDWSAQKYGKPIGDDAAIGCWQAMYTALYGYRMKQGSHDGQG